MSRKLIFHHIDNFTYTTSNSRQTILMFDLYKFNNISNKVKSLDGQTISDHRHILFKIKIIKKKFKFLLTR